MDQQVNLDSLPDYVAHMQLFPLINALRKKKKIVVIAGAGISASAGIPTFDDMPAAKKTFDKNMYNNNDSTKLINETMCNMYYCIQDASATQFHLVLETLAKEGRLQRLYTQNIDGIDTQLEPLKTLIPLPEKGPWPKTVQLHGDLRTIQCQKNPQHLSRFNPALFTSASLPGCIECENQKRSLGGSWTLRTVSEIPVLRPRVWLYNEYDYADKDAITMVKEADLKAKPDVVIVVGTALKINSAKMLVREMCAAAAPGAFTAWINLKPPPKDLDCFKLVVQGNCETVAMHVSSWWLKECPTVLSDTQIQSLQEKCGLFIAKSPGAALNRALADLDDDSLSKILQQHENYSRILHVKDNGKEVFASAERSQTTSLSGTHVELDWTPINEPLPAPRATLPKSLDVLPKLSDCWRIDMSKRLSEVVVGSSTVVTNITKLDYETQPEKSLWRLKPGEWLDDEIINTYIELLQRSITSPSHKIANSFTMMMPNRPYTWFSKLLDTGSYTIYLPVNQKEYHWSFAVITTNNREDALRWTYYDSVGASAPVALLDWIQRWFSNKTIEELTASPNPKQSNGCDCGLFVLIGIRLLSTGRPHLTQAESNDLLPTLRERVLAELLASSIDPSEMQYQEFKLKEANAEAVLLQVSEDSDDDSDCVIISTKPCDQSNEPKLFVSGSRASDSGGVKKNSPEHIASAFAEEAAILGTLKEAVAIERAAQQQHQNLAAENLRLAELWLMIRTEKRALKQRYIHYEFSRQFWAVMKGFGRSPHERGPVPKATISKVMSKLEIRDRANWKYILKRARKASVWTELIDIFKRDLEHPTVVLCAVPNATYRLETLTVSNRKVFLETIRSRLEERDNGILARLKAASALYWTVMYSGLPLRELPIESGNEDLPFEQKVSSGK